MLELDYVKCVLIISKSIVYNDNAGLMLGVRSEVSHYYVIHGGGHRGEV